MISRLIRIAKRVLLATEPSKPYKKQQDDFLFNVLVSNQAEKFLKKYRKSGTPFKMLTDAIEELATAPDPRKLSEGVYKSDLRQNVGGSFKRKKGPFRIVYDVAGSDLLIYLLEKRGQMDTRRGSEDDKTNGNS